MRGGIISLCQFAVAAAALLMLAWFGIVWLIGAILVVPGKLISRMADLMAADFDDDMIAAFQWLEDRR